MTSICVSIPSDKVQATIKALVDSGNSVTAGIAISGNLHKRLLVGFSSLKTKKNSQNGRIPSVKSFGSE